MKLKVTSSDEKYGAPVGLYQAKFLGAKADTHPEYGAGLKWEWKVVGGPSAGKIVGRTTAPAPTLKNSCGKILQMITGGLVRADQEIDIDPYVGQVFQVMVEPNSSGNGTRVGSVMPLAAAPAPQPPASAAPPPSRPAPPPPPRLAPGTSPNPVAAEDARLSAHYWVQLPDWPEPKELTGQQLLLHCRAAKDQAAWDAIAVMDAGQSSGWQKPAHFGFKSEIPF